MRATGWISAVAMGREPGTVREIAPEIVAVTAQAHVMGPAAAIVAIARARRIAPRAAATVPRQQRVAVIVPRPLIAVATPHAVAAVAVPL